MYTLMEVYEYWIQLGGYGEFIEFLQIQFFPVFDDNRIVGFVRKTAEEIKIAARN